MRIAGVDIGGTSIKVGIFEDSTLLRKTSAQTPFRQPQAVCDEIARMLKDERIAFVGVGTAGSVNIAEGTVSASNLGWTDVPLRRMLSEILQLPVWVDNDAQAALMAEWMDGVCKDCECALYLTLGTGIGGAMIVDGKPYRGKNNLGAEFGHMITHACGPKCGCGRRGCLEYYASATALRRMGGGKSTQEIIHLAKSGEPKMRAVFDRYVRELVLGMNNLIMAYDPEIIVLGGGVSGAGAFLSDACQKELARLFSQTTDPLLCHVRIAHHQNDAGIIGAAGLAKMHFLK